MNIKNFTIDLLDKNLPDFAINAKWGAVNFELEKYLLEEGYHSLDEVPNTEPSEPLDDKSLDEKFVWMPFHKSNGRILLMLPLPDKDSKMFDELKSRVCIIDGKTIIGVGQFLGLSAEHEYYQFNFSPDLIPSSAKLLYDNEKISLEEPGKRLGNGIKERFFAEGGAGLQISGGGGSSEPGIPLPGAPQGFLWKPVSDSTGTLAVLVPENGGHGGCIVNGDSGKFTGTGNGGRAHYRFGKPGGAYPMNTTCATARGTFIIPNPALRYEGAG